MRQEVQENQSVDPKIMLEAFHKAIEMRNKKALQILQDIEKLGDEQRKEILQDMGKNFTLIMAIDNLMEDLTLKLIELLKASCPEALFRRDQELGSPANYAIEKKQIKVLIALYSACKEVGIGEAFFSNARMPNSDDKFLAVIKKIAAEYEDPNKIRAAAGVKSNETEDAPLNDAVHDFNLEMLRLLLAMHASPNMGGNQGKTPLQTAIDVGDKCQAAKLLLDSKSDDLSLKALCDEAKPIKNKDFKAYVEREQILDVIDRSCPPGPEKLIKYKVGNLKVFLAEKRAINDQMQDILRRAEANDTESIISAVVSALENGQSIIINGVDMTQTHLRMPSSVQDQGAGQSI